MTPKWIVYLFFIFAAIAVFIGLELHKAPLADEDERIVKEKIVPWWVDALAWGFFFLVMFMIQAVTP